MVTTVSHVADEPVLAERSGAELVADCCWFWGAMMNHVTRQCTVQGALLLSTTW